MSEHWTVNGNIVEITHSERVLFPEDGITKGDLAAYYRDVATFILLHVLNRPLHMQRFPRGIGEEGFVQKEAPDNAPRWIERVTVEKEGGHVTHMMANNAAALVYMANMSSITPHVWQSRSTNIERPDRLILDLDPAEDDFMLVRASALALRVLLDELELPAFLMTTGSRGLHVVVPIRPEREFDLVRSVAQTIAEELIRRDPDRLTMEMRKQDRRGRLFVDTLRNSYGATAVAPYAVRARGGAPVAAPLDWAELDDPKLNARAFTLRNIQERLVDRGDLWAGIESAAISIEDARRRVRALKPARSARPPRLHQAA